jgi:hypothetical protein
MLSGYTGSHVSSVCDFGSITLLFSDHTPNINVSENNGVTLSKPQMKDIQAPVWPDNMLWSPFLDCPKYVGQF